MKRQKKHTDTSDINSQHSEFVVAPFTLVKNLKQNEARGTVHLVVFMYLVFTRMPGESYRRQLSGHCC